MINIHEKFNTIIDIFEDQISQKSLRIHNKCTEELINNKVEIDEARFGLIIFNIINNSAKYTRPNDKITISAKVVKQFEMNFYINTLK